MINFVSKDTKKLRPNKRIIGFYSHSPKNLPLRPIDLLGSLVILVTLDMLVTLVLLVILVLLVLLDLKPAEPTNNKKALTHF